MDARTRAMILGGVALLVLSAIFAVIFYQIRSSKNTTESPIQTSDDALNRLRLTPVPGTGTPASTGVTAGFKIYAGQGFSLRYPSTWGLLTCSNSQNFELDPTNNQDVKGAICDRALKSVTVLLQKGVCRGGTVTLGNVTAVKAKTSSGTETDYEWCFSAAGKNFDISHRVSGTGSRATSKEDFSAQIEDIIKTISSVPQGS